MVAARVKPIGGGSEHPKAHVLFLEFRDEYDSFWTVERDKLWPHRRRSPHGSGCHRLHPQALSPGGYRFIPDYHGRAWRKWEPYLNATGFVGDVRKDRFSEMRSELTLALNCAAYL
jgi:hypothetical protein